MLVLMFGLEISGVAEDVEVVAFLLGTVVAGKIVRETEVHPSMTEVRQALLIPFGFQSLED